MSDTVFVTMYNPNLGNVQVDAPLQAVSTYQAHGWLLLDPAATAPPIASPYLSQPAADSRYLRDWAGAEALTAGAVRVAPDGHVIVRTADGTTRSTYDGTEAALWTALGGANDPALRAAYVTNLGPPTGGDDTAALQAALTAGGRVILQAGTYMVTGLTASVPVELILNHQTTVKWANNAGDGSGVKSLLRVSSSGVRISGGTFDANRAGMDQAAFNAAGGSNGGRYQFGIYATGSLSNVHIDTRVINSVDNSFNISGVDDTCTFNLRSQNVGAGPSFSSASAVVVPTCSVVTVDNTGWKVFPHAVDFTNVAKVRVGRLSITDQAGSGTVAAGTSLSDFLSGLTILGASSVSIDSLHVESRKDSAQRPGVGVSVLGVSNMRVSQAAIIGYSELGLEMGGCVGHEWNDVLIDGRYQTSAVAANGRGWSLYNNAYYPDISSRSQRFTSEGKFTNVQVRRCLGEGIYLTAAQNNTFVNCSVRACQYGMRHEYIYAEAAATFPGAAVADLSGNRFISCDWSFNELAGVRFVDGANVDFVSCRSNNNGQANTYPTGSRRNGATLTSYGFGAVTSSSVGLSKTGLRLLAHEARDTQSWGDSASAVSSAPKTIIASAPQLYHVGQTIWLEGCGASGVRLVTRIDDIQLDAVTIADAITTFPTVAGTGTITSTGASVVGSGTGFNAAIKNRLYITAGGQTRQVVKVTDDTHLTVDSAFSPDVSGASFTIYKITTAAPSCQTNGIQLSADTISPTLLSPRTDGNQTADLLDGTVASTKVGVYASGRPAATTILDNGETSLPRLAVVTTALPLSSGGMRLACFEAQKTEVITSVRVPTGGTAAGATPTLIRVGVYSVNGNGDLTLVASTPNDTTLLAAASTSYSKNLSASFVKRAGTQYAVGVLVVSAAAMPTLTGNNVMGGSAAEAAVLPRLSGLVGSLSDLPSSVASGSISSSNQAPYAALVP